MKATLEFDDIEELKLALQAPNMRDALDEIRNQLFRPIRKHGFSDPKILEALKTLDEGSVINLFWELEQKFNEILDENKIEQG